MKSKKIVIIDIDGVLVPYPSPFEKYVYDLLKIKYSLNEIKSLEQYKLLKYSYRISSIKRKLPLLNKDIPTIINNLKNLYNVWIVTTRPIETSGMDTLSWLETNEIKYDEIFFVNDKINFIDSVKNNVCAVIDDSDDNLIPFRDNRDSLVIHIKKPSDWSKIMKRFGK